MNKIEFAKLAFDNYKGRVSGNYSAESVNDVLYKELVEANGGRTSIDYKDVIYGRCNEVFEIITQIIDEVKHDIMTTDPFFVKFVDYRNLARGDKNEFVIKNKAPFIVSKIGAGSQALRRQRLVGGETFSIDTALKGVKVYEELELLLARRIDFNELIDLVERSFRGQVITDIYTAWSGTITNLASPYAVTGSFTESQMLNLIQHVKAANGSRDAYIMGTLVALNKVVGSGDSSAQVALESKYYNGFAGMFDGVPKLEVANAYKPGTHEFLLSDNVVDVFASDVKPIMYVTEGQSLILRHPSIDNMDLTEEYMLVEKTGVGARVPDGEGMFGRYTISA